MKDKYSITDLILIGLIILVIVLMIKIGFSIYSHSKDESDDRNCEFCNIYYCNQPYQYGSNSSYGSNYDPIRGYNHTTSNNTYKKWHSISN